jgi:hypothetical protein
MRRFLIVTANVFAICTSIVFAHRVLAYKETFSNAFVERLSLDSKLIAGQWTWREIYPKRHTMEAQ